MRLCLAWRRFDNVRVPRENLLNAVADVTADGRYMSAISDPDQVSHMANMHSVVLFVPLCCARRHLWS